MHFAFLFNEKTTLTHNKLTQFIFGKRTVLGLRRKILTVVTAVCGS